jgi:hypothetical protein
MSLAGTGLRLLAATVLVGTTTAPAAFDERRPAEGLDLDAPYDGLYHFVRVRYGGGDGFGLGFGNRRRDATWSHDYPRAEHNFLKIVREATLVPALVEGSNVFALDDPELFMYPAAYLVEPGFWQPSDEEARALGEYLEKGGFLIVDDFRGDYELDNLRAQLRRVLPDGNMVLVEDSDAIFDSFFRVTPQEVVPPYGGLPPLWYGIYEDNDPGRRLQVIINHNNDMAEYWEYSDFGFYPIDLSNEAYKLGVNYVVYALTH